MMYDRVLKAELMNSDRWLDLPSDSHRLAYVCLIPLADDFGNMEGGARRLWRYLHGRTQLKDEAHAVKVLAELMDADLLRPYKADDTEYWHLPRFECDRKYVCRRVPASPWDDPELEAKARHYRAYHKARRVDSKTKIGKSDPDLTLNRPRVDPVQGLGVGVGEKKKTNKAPARPELPGIPPAPAQPPPAVEEDFWTYGVKVILPSVAGEKTAREFLGHLLKSWSQADVMEALMSAHGSSADPKSYVIGILKNRPKKGREQQISANGMAVKGPDGIWRHRTTGQPCSEDGLVC